MRTASRKILFAAALLLAAVLRFSPACAASDADRILNSRPANYVNDYANTLSRETYDSLNSLIKALDERTSAQVAVAILPSIEPYALEDYAVKLFEKWGIGGKGKDNGALILVALNERHIRIEVGYGLEGGIPDGVAGEIIDRRMVPYFKSGDFDGGVRAGVEAVVGEILREYDLSFDDLAAGYRPGVTPPSEAMPGRVTFLHKLIGLAFAIFMIILFIRHPTLFLLLLLSGGRGGGWSRGGGGFGGGFGGFGGGMSGGGGASGGW